jgi:hypothetical protein
MRFATRAISWGIAIYAVMYLAWSGLVIYGLSFGLVSLIIRLAVLVAVTSAAVRSLRVVSPLDVLPYSIAWGVVAAILDSIFLVPFAGWSLYTEWSVLLGYALVALIPFAISYVFSRGRA